MGNGAYNGIDHHGRVVLALIALYVLTAIALAGTLGGHVMFVLLLVAAPSVVGVFDGPRGDQFNWRLILGINLLGLAVSLVLPSLVPTAAAIGAMVVGSVLATHLRRQDRDPDGTPTIQVARKLEGTDIGSGAEGRAGSQVRELDQLSAVLHHLTRRFHSTDKLGLGTACLVMIVPTIGCGAALADEAVSSNNAWPLWVMAFMHGIAYPAALGLYAFAVVRSTPPRRLAAVRATLILTVLTGAALMCVIFSDPWTFAEAVALMVAMILIPRAETGSLRALILAAGALVVAAVTLLPPLPVELGYTFGKSFAVLSLAYLVAALALTRSHRKWHRFRGEEGPFDPSPEDPDLWPSDDYHDDRSGVDPTTE